MRKSTIERRGFLVGSAVAGLIASAHAAEPQVQEPPLLPALEIVDPHHHMTYTPAKGGRPAQHFLLTDLAKDIADSGQNVVATVAVEAFGFYPPDVPPAFKPVNETEVLDGIAAMSASGMFGPARVAAGIIAYASLRLGDGIKPVLDAHARAAGNRLKGIRDSSAWDAYPAMGMPLDPARGKLFDDPAAIVGMHTLAERGLTLDAWCFHPQIPKIAAAAHKVPELTMILDHLGSPLAVGPYAGKEREVFRDWKAAIRDAAKVPNLVLKLGGLGMQFSSPSVYGRNPPPTSIELAALWKPFIETCIEAFGVQRCMFESNFPPDGGTAPYGVFWNAFKRITEHASDAERAALFSGTAKRIYRLG